jgi:hypothetical protein
VVGHIVVVAQTLQEQEFRGRAIREEMGILHHLMVEVAVVEKVHLVSLEEVIL